MKYLIAVLFLVCTLHQVARSTDSLTNKVIVLDLKRTRDGNLYYTTLDCGRSAQQHFNLLVSTSSDNLWVRSSGPGSIRLDGYKDSRTELFSLGNGFRTDKADHYWTDIFMGQDAIGSKQYVTVRSMTKEQTNMTGVETNNLRHKYGVDGLLGIESNKFALYETGSIVRELFTQLGSKQLVSLYLNGESGSSEDAVAGKLIFGAIDHSLYTGQIEYIPMKEHPREGWSSHLNWVELDWSRVVDSRSQERSLTMKALPKNDRIELRFSILKLDSSAHLFTGPIEMMHKFHINHMRAKPTGSRGIYAFNDCSLEDKPDFVFRLSDRFELRIKPEDYVVKLNDGSSNEICISAFKGSNSHLFVFGTRLMRKFYLVFDYENKQLGWAKPI